VVVVGTIVCGVDGTEESRTALRFAAAMYERLGGSLVIVYATRVPTTFGAATAPHAQPPATGVASDAAAEAGLALLERVSVEERLGPASRLRSEIGGAAERLLGVAREEDADFVVLGTRRRGRIAAVLSGSVSRTVVGASDRPVILVPRESGTSPRGPVICGIDEAGRSREAARAARRLGVRLHLPLVLAHAVTFDPIPGGSAVPGATAELAQLERQRAKALLDRVAAEEHLGHGVERLVVAGDPADALADLAARESASLVVVGSRGRGRLASAVLGSTCSSLTARAPCAVMVVPAASDERSWPPDRRSWPPDSRVKWPVRLR
jgi:nucleotide-binding universal stress UspA family protein